MFPFRKKYVNPKQLEAYKTYKTINAFGIAEPPILSWDFLLHHTDEEIAAREQEVIRHLHKKIADLD